MVIGLKIKELRKEKKLTQKEFSSKIGIDDSQLSKIEQGKLMPTLSQLMEISSIFEVSMDWLIGKEDVFSISIEETTPTNNDKYITSLEKINALQEEKITAQSKQIEELIKKIERLEQENKAFQGGSQDRAVR